MVAYMILAEIYNKCRLKEDSTPKRFYLRTSSNTKKGSETTCQNYRSMGIIVEIVWQNSDRTKDEIEVNENDGAEC